MIEHKKFPRINFIGNKDKIANWICDNLPKDSGSFFDAFSGGGSVSYAAKVRGLSVASNDILKINYLVAKALIENSRETLNSKDIELIFKGKPIKGYMYEHYTNVYFFADECQQLDLYRKNIDKLGSANKQAIALALMRRAMIRKMPYSRFNIRWDKVKQLRNEEYSYEKYKRRRAYHNQSFQDHFLASLNGFQAAIFDNGRPNKAYNKDVFELVGKVEADVIYLDPPYSSTMNNYYGFYGLLDEYIDSEKKQPFKNDFTDKKLALARFDNLFSKLSTYKYWMLSYNNSSYPTKQELIELIKKYASSVKVIERPHVYKITGKVQKQKNIEYLFIVKR